MEIERGCVWGGGDGVRNKGEGVGGRKEGRGVGDRKKGEGGWSEK